MDLVSVLVIVVVCLLCLLPLAFGSFRSFDGRANELEGQDPETANALRAARRDIDRGKGRYGP